MTVIPRWPPQVVTLTPKHGTSGRPSAACIKKMIAIRIVPTQHCRHAAFVLIPLGGRNRAQKVLPVSPLSNLQPISWCGGKDKVVTSLERGHPLYITASQCQLPARRSRAIIRPSLQFIYLHAADHRHTTADLLSTVSKWLGSSSN